MTDSAWVQVQPSNGIRPHFLRVVMAFKELLQALQAVEGNRLSRGSVEDEISAFQVWAGTNGVHQKGRSSLDYKLQLASQVRGYVIGELVELEQAIRKGSVYISVLEPHADRK